MKSAFCDFCKINVAENAIEDHAKKHNFVNGLTFHEAMSITDLQG